MSRPREHNREQIAIDIVEWARKLDSINLCKFCALYDPPIPPYKLGVWSKEDDKFRIAVDTAKAFLGFRREEWLNQEMLHVKGYDLNAETYDYFLKEEKRQKAEFESNLKKEEEGAKQTTINLMVPHDLAIGSNLPTEAIPVINNKGSK